MEFIILIMIFAIACAIKFLYYCIGSPFVNHDGVPVFNSGRIFSIYGRFICSQYAKHHNNETKRIRAKYERIKESKRLVLESQMETATDAERIELIKKFETELNSIDFESLRRPNPFMMAGLCPICFGTWISILSWIIIGIAFAINPILIMFFIPSSVVISNRIDFG